MLAIKKICLWVAYGTILLLTFLVLFAAIIRFVVYPNIEEYKNDLEVKISNEIGLKTTIGKIETDWEGVSPRLLISAIDIYNQDNVSALHLENIKTKISWKSIPLLQPHLSYISIRRPKLTVQRNMDGSLAIAGISLSSQGNSSFANWILSQKKIKIKDASIIWRDDLNQAPPLSLDKVNIKLYNPAWRQLFGQHVLTASALPSVGTKHPITIDGTFFGRDMSQIESWHGNFNIKAQEIDLAIWQKWIDYPIDLQSGSGSAEVEFGFLNQAVTKLEADVALEDLSGKVDADKKGFNAAALSGLISWTQDVQATTLLAKNLHLVSEDNLNIDNGFGSFSYSTKDDVPWIEASANLDHFDLRHLKTLEATTKLPATLAQQLKQLSPKGQLSNIRFKWEGTTDTPTHYQFKSRFKGLSMHAYKRIPGFKNLSGQIDANDINGMLALETSNAAIDIKKVFRRPIPLSKLNGKVTWSKYKDSYKLAAKNIAISTPHIHGSVNASYVMNGIKGGYLDVIGSFDDGNIQYAPFYYPKVLSKPVTNWLESAIISGKASDIKLTLKGHLDDFPYVDKRNKRNPNLGIFRVAGTVNNAKLKYGEDWPAINDIGLDLLFEGNSMHIKANKGTISNFKITGAEVKIPELNTKSGRSQVLTVSGQGEGLIRDGIQFINTSPVKKIAQGFTDTLKTAGYGGLDLNLSIPLKQIKNATFDGTFNIKDGTMYANANTGVPEITHIFGALNFDDSGIRAKELRGELLGGSARVDLNTGPDSTFTIKGSGLMTGQGLRKAEPSVLADALEGEANWQADIVIKKPTLNLAIRSDLVGMAVKLPAPLGKPAQQKAAFTFNKKQTVANKDAIDIAYKQIALANILRTAKNGQLAIKSGDVAINTPLKTPVKAGIALRGQLDYVNADDWLSIVKDANKGKTSSLTIGIADISINKLDLFSRSLNKVKLSAKPYADHVKMSLNSQELSGNVKWLKAKNAYDNDKIVARLKKLHIPDSQDEKSSPFKERSNDIRRLDRKYPALDVEADDFRLGKKALGELALTAFARDDDWVIEKLKISNRRSTLSAEGIWHNWTRNPNTKLNFNLTTEDIGDTMKRFGQANTVDDGTAIISGRLQWPGSPHEFATEDLSGEFSLSASEGHILKVQPGFGRLLGLLSLQSLPRRLTLDFSDLFSEGFAFDYISASAKINHGILRSDDFYMTGPAAETEIKGETNLRTETQNLTVKVTPHISDSVSLAALVGGPFTAAAAWLAQKILKDPLNKIAQSEYTIGGTWSNPIEIDNKKDQENSGPRPTSPLNAQQY